MHGGRALSQARQRKNPLPAEQAACEPPPDISSPLSPSPQDPLGGSACLWTVIEIDNLEKTASGASLIASEAVRRDGRLPGSLTPDPENWGHDAHVVMPPIIPPSPG